MRKSTFFGLLSLAAAWMTGTSAYAWDEPALVDGYYQLSTASHVEWFSEQVEANNIDINGVLLNDIDFTGVEHTPIGTNTGRKYNGTFDGRGHRIMNMVINRPNVERQGFFGCLRGNPNTRGEATVIKNLIIDKSCHIIGGKRSAGICGSGQNNEMPIYIINCVNEALVETSSNNAAGILGGSESNHPKWQILNCVNAGKIVSTNSGAECAGITAWCGDNNGVLIENCINIGEVVGIDGNKRGIFRHSGSLTARNNFDLSTTAGATQGKTLELTAEDLLSGKACYQLNTTIGSLVYYQTLNEDTYPMPLDTHKQVYLQGQLRCDGTPLPSGVYTNVNQAPTIPDHETHGDNFYCVNCGKVDDKFCPQVDGVYQLNSVADMMWLAAYVNEGHPTVNAVLNSDLDFTGVTDFVPVGTADNPYRGTFDGKHHCISHLVIDRAENNVGVFGYLNGGVTLKNLRLDATCSISGAASVGLAGIIAKSGDSHFSGLGVECPVSGTGKNVGGILGCNTGSAAKIYMDNCYVTGDVSGSNESGVLSGWLGSNAPVVTNCWSISQVSGAENAEKYQARHSGGIFTNCYAVYGSQFAAITAEDAASGALCYKLNGDQTDVQWYQTLGEDVLPTLDDSHGQVYLNGQIHCDGTPISVAYENVNKGMVRPDHELGANGFCRNCSTNLMTELAVDDEDGYYLISNAGELELFSDIINHAGQAVINAKLVDDIDLAGVTHAPIGGAMGKNDSNKFQGTFDGQGHRILNMTEFPYTKWVGLFGMARGGATIKNVTIDYSCHVKGDTEIGAVLAVAQAGSDPVTIMNCVNEGKVEATGNHASGIFGKSLTAGLPIKLINCANLGIISAGNNAVALGSWMTKSDLSEITNCWNVGYIIKADWDMGFREDWMEEGHVVAELNLYTGNGPIALNNCWDASESEFRTQGTLLPMDAMDTGELAYKVGGVWGQTLGEDIYPMIGEEHRPVKMQEVKVGEAGVATFVTYLENYDMWPEDVQVQEVYGVDRGLLLTRDAEVEAGKPVILMAESPVSYELYGNEADAADMPMVNGLLHGVLKNTLAPVGSYVLQNLDGKLGFYQVAEGTQPTVQAGHAYLLAPEVAAKALYLDGTVDGIANVETAQPSNAVIFNLAGQRVQRMQNGIYIVNGKKVLVK